MRIVRILQLAISLWSPILLGQGTFTAATCNFADVDTIIEGPMHVAVTGDVIIIPAGSCTWNATQTVNPPPGAGITVKGVGTPNNSPSQMGANASCSQTVITDNVGALFSFQPNALVTSRFSCMKLVPFNPYPNAVNPVYAVGSATVCTLTDCPQFRFDNIVLPSSWIGAGQAAGILVTDNVFGVADHNTVGDGTASMAFSNLVNVNFGHWQGAGSYGDNSWATADTFGTKQMFYLENNVFQYVTGTDMDTGGSDYGGGRAACRFNSFTPPMGTCANHGTDTTGRNRGGRQLELYDNTWICPSGTACPDVFTSRSGPMLAFDNTQTAGGDQPSNLYNWTVQRRWRGNGSFGQCGGQPDAGIWDTTDSTQLGPYTITAVNAAAGTVTVAGAPWTPGQFNNFASPFSLVDTTQTIPGVTNGGKTNTINTNTANVLTVFDFGADWTPAVNDTFKIERATVCLDQSTRGQGALVRDTTPGSGIPVLNSSGVAGPVNNALDPNYAAHNGGNPGNGLSQVGDPGIVGNRDYYIETANQGAQTSSTSPFDGTTTIGMGHGTLALRPATCTPSVGYWATDQGTWNTSGIGGQGQLYICTSTNTWTLSYTPFTYPHPLITNPAPTVITKNKKLNTLLVTE